MSAKSVLLTWSNYNSEQLTLDGTTTSTNAGHYNATFTPNNDYMWSDGSTAAKTVMWSIEKAEGSMNLSATTMALNPSALTGQITVARAGNGTITASSSNDGVAIVNVSGTTVTVTGVSGGSATITVRVAEGTNHTAPANQTCEVVVSLVSNVLNDNDWDTISEVSAQNQGENYWSVGDMKTVFIRGRVGNLDINDSFNVYILGFNHNSDVEGKGIQFGGFVYNDSDSYNVCLIDDQYGKKAYFGDYPPFIMGENGVNRWEDSYIRKSILYDLREALPDELQNVLKPITKGTFMGSTSEGDPYIEYVVDYLTIPSEAEVFDYSDTGGAQKQYAYYAAGNSKIKYGYINGEALQTACWWLRDVVLRSEDNYNIVTEDGTIGRSIECYSYGVSPIFMV